MRSPRRGRRRPAPAPPPVGAPARPAEARPAGATRVELTLRLASRLPVLVPYDVELTDARGRAWGRARWHAVSRAHLDPARLEGAALLLEPAGGGPAARIEIAAAVGGLPAHRVHVPPPRPGGAEPWTMLPHRVEVAAPAPLVIAAALDGPRDAVLRGVRAGGAPLEDPEARGRPLERRARAGCVLRVELDAGRFLAPPPSSGEAAPDPAGEIERTLEEIVGEGKLVALTRAHQEPILRVARLALSPALTPSAAEVELLELLLGAALLSPASDAAGTELISAVDALLAAFEARLAREADLLARLRALRERHLRFSGPGSQAERNFQAALACEELGDLFKRTPDRSPIRAGQVRFHDEGTVRNAAEVATRLGQATSTELACVAAVALADLRVRGVELLGVAGGRAFVSIGRAPDSDLARPETWGPACVLADPYGRSTSYAREWSRALGAELPEGTPVPLLGRRLS